MFNAFRGTLSFMLFVLLCYGGQVATDIRLLFKKQVENDGNGLTRAPNLGRGQLLPRLQGQLGQGNVHQGF